jgi:hypothetical protein
MATLKLLGRLTAGAGPFEEIAISALVATALNSATGAAFLAALGVGGFETGDIKYTFATTAPVGWLMLQGGTGTPPSTIGNAASGANLRANADCLSLYTVVYNACADAEAPVSGGRTGNAVNDFNANKTIRVPNLVGRTTVGAGGATDAPPSGGAATTVKTIGRGYGSETATLVTANLPPYTPAGSNSGITVTHPSGFRWPITNGSIGNNFGAGGGSQSQPSTGATWTEALSLTGSGPSFTGTAQGGSSVAFSIIDSKIALNVMVKL